MSTTVLTDITLVLGPPRHDTAAFDDFQQLAELGDAVSDHAWAAHEHTAIDALTARDGGITTPTLLETIVGGVLGVNVIIADVSRCWVRHADRRLYVAVRFNCEDVRPRAAGVALQQEATIETLNAVAATLSELDGREWLAWSSHSWQDAGGAEQLARTSALMAEIAAHVLGDASSDAVKHEGATAEPVPDAAVDLTADLVRAIAAGHAHAGLVHASDAPHTLVQTLRALRLHDPLRFEWQLVSMDAFFLGAQPLTRVRETMNSAERRAEAAGLAFLYIGKDRTDRLKADPWITPRFRRELVARAYLTAYALRRLAPAVAQTLLDVMRPPAD